MLPLVHDLADRRALRRKCDRTWLDVVIVAVIPAITSALTVSDLMTRWLASLTPLIHAGLPGIALVVTAFVIAARERERGDEAGFVSGPPKAVWIYRFCHPARTTAKIVFVPLVALASLSGWAVTPNALRGRDFSGYVCKANGSPMAGFIEITSRSGTSLGRAALDDRGFFFIRAAAWSLAPDAIAIFNSECGRVKQSFRTGAHGESCPSERPESPQTGRAPVWLIPCP